MGISTANQAYIFLVAVCSGLALGLIYDIYRAVRIIIKPKRWFVAILDFLFWILATSLVFYTLFRINGGEIRLYIVIGLALGWGIFALSIGGIVTKILVKSYNIVRKILLWPFRMISRLVAWMGKKLPQKKKKEYSEDA
ncbi:MAG: spore cortex biosynthesis protein YabQ [Clostridiales bacterium]|nr:spore cortex biosynthesis protein YabQ [Clostridiales bacterium]